MHKIKQGGVGTHCILCIILYGVQSPVDSLLNNSIVTNPQTPKLCVLSFPSAVHCAVRPHRAPLPCASTVMPLYYTANALGKFCSAPTLLLKSKGKVCYGQESGPSVEIDCHRIVA